MALIVRVIDGSPMPGGQRMIRGSILLDSSYPTGGEYMNIANGALLGMDALKASGSPTVVVGAAPGYVLVHDQGTAANGKVKAYYATNAIINAALGEVVNGTSLSTINAAFYAIGPAY